MKGSNAIGIAAALCVLSCSEPVPQAVNSSSVSSEKNFTRPVVISAEDYQSEQPQDATSIGNGLVVVYNDRNSELDQSAVRENRQLRSRAASGATIKASGLSRITQRVYYTLGEVSRYNTYAYDPVTGARTQRIQYDSPGVDMIWFNEDDQIRNVTSYDVTVNQVTTLMVRYNGPGVDGIWLNEDDSVQRYMTELVDAAGASIGVLRFNGPGLDLAWFTDDDDVQYLSVDTMAADGSDQWVQYRTAGLDADWSTLDDNEVGHFSLTTVNADGLHDRHVFFMDAGLDLIPFNEDDTVGYYHDFISDAAGMVINTVLYSDAGTDLAWFTGDDLADVCQEITYTADGKTDQTTSATSGVDVACFTADDVVVRNHVDAYDETAHQIGATTYDDPGVDLLWFTADDVIGRESTYEPI